ncbi:hypothetical protein [Flavihumibacter fluvii]|uniref:hypothetical protein n=1 Tax=Flavihumibacter fluvii TaxID=2838157 RepID=UPI001BDF273F|nr:hypothetical protein [Flavihumibacter fluvii]ULQ52467.1 hypothetical protein KJS93_20475 [Flavihumibacter fluvii]
MNRKILPAKYLLTGIVMLMVSAPTICLLFYQVKLCHNRFEMLERLEKESLHAITLSAAEITWAIPGKELRIRGRLFDVKEIKTHGITTTFTGIYDEEEEALEKKISERSDPGNNRLPTLVKMAITPVIQNDIITLQPFTTLKHTSFAFGYTQQLAFYFEAPKGPPPRNTC